MKKLFFFILTAFLLSAVLTVGQTVKQAVVKLKTTDLGNQQLFYDPNDAVYYILLKTGHDIDPYVQVTLGIYDNAIRLLTNLQDFQLKKGDTVDFENISENTATWDGFGYRVGEPMNPWTGQLRKANIKGFIKSIEENEEKMQN